MTVVHSTRGYGCDMRQLIVMVPDLLTTWTVQTILEIRWISDEFFILSIIMNSKLDRSCRERKLLQKPPISHIAKQ